MVIYPVIIPTLCRYEHLIKCVRSLSECSLADQTELVIGLDYPLNEKQEPGYIKIKEFIKKITGFKKVTIFTTTKNLGAESNLNRLIEYVYQTYEAVIITEDDNYFSPCFLEFMNTALNKFMDDFRIMSVCGYNAVMYEGVTDNSIILTHDNSAWGIGLWKGKNDPCDLSYYDEICHSFTKSYRLFKEYPALLSMLIVMLKRKERYGDTMRTTCRILDDTYQLRPALSMVRNLGQDGSGLHSGINPELLSQTISNEKHFLIDDAAIKKAFEEKAKTNKYLFRQGLSKSWPKAMCQLILWFWRGLLYNLLAKRI